MHVDSPAGPDRLIFTLASEADTDRLGRALAAILSPGDVVGLVGTLGAGKTRLSRAIAEAQGVDPLAVASPTFVLIHEYDGSAWPVYHFDAYRLPDAAAFDALGVVDYWAEGAGLCLIEWADLVADRLPPDAWWVRLAPAADPAGRTVAVSHPDRARLRALAAAFMQDGR